MKDFALLAVSFYLLKQDLLRLSLASGRPENEILSETLRRTA
jgi:hypothetical protein